MLFVRIFGIIIQGQGLCTKIITFAAEFTTG